MIGAGLLLVLCASQTFSAQEVGERIWRTSKITGFSGDLDTELVPKWNVSLLIAGYSNLQYGSNNIQYGQNNIQHGSNNIQYGNNNLQYGEHNIQYGSHNIQYGRHNIQYGVNNIQNGNNGVQFIDILTNVTYEKTIQDGERQNYILPLPVAEDIYFSNGLKDSSNDAVYFKVERNDRTTAEDNTQDVRLITLTSSSPLQYNSGDTFMIRPRNCQDAIDDLFRMFNNHELDIKPGYKLLVEAMHDSMQVPSFLQTPLTVHRIAEQYWDLTAYPTLEVFSLLAQIAEDNLEKEEFVKLSSPEGHADYSNNHSRRTILEVLNDFPKTTSKLTVSNLFELFSTIKPQSFSIVSSNLRSPNSLDLLVAEHAEVENSTKLQLPRKGLCSNWLAGLSKEDAVYGWINKGNVVY